MSKRFRNIILIIIGSILFLVLAAVVLAYALQDKVKQQIVVQINNQITVPVQVKGSIDFSLLKHFPYASLSFNEVTIDDKLRKGKQLLRVKEVSLLCNVFSLFGNKIELSKILVRDGNINLYKDENGKLNFDILKPVSPNGAKSDLGVQLKRAEIKNVHFTYVDKILSSLTDVELKDVQLKGNFSSAQFDLQSTLTARVNEINASGQKYLFNRNVKADIVLEVNNSTHHFTFKKGNISIEDNEFIINGFFATLKNGTQLDFTLTNEGKDLRKLVGLIPEKYRQAFDQAEGNGQYAISASVKGMVTNSAGPKVRVDADLINSEIKLGKYNKLLKKVNAKAKYEMDEAGNDRIVISNFDCTLNELPFNFRLSLTKLSDPDFDFFAQGTLHLSEISSFVPDSIMHDLGGTISFNNFRLKGRKRDFTDVENSTLTGSGEFKMQDIEFQQGGISYGNINGLLKYHDQVIEADNLTANFLSNQATFTGNITRLAAFIYNLSINRSANNVVLGVNGKLKLKTFNLSGIIDAYNKKSHPQAMPKGKIDLREIVNMAGNLDIEMEKFIFRKMEFDNVTGNLQVAPGNIRCNNLQAKTMGGDVQINGNIVFGDDYSINLAYDVSAIKMSIPAMFAECEGFGQTVLSDRHLKGTLDAAVSFNATWDNYKVLNQDKLNAIVDFTIKNGELIKFEPLKAASKFIRVEELEDIRFASLHNTIKIGNRRIDIPLFEIQSSALNLMFEGTHWFNDSIDYSIKVNLHKLLAQKFNRNKRDDIQYMEEDPYEGLNLYLRMTGSLGNPHISYNKKGTKNKIKSDFKNEKENLKNLMRNTTPKMDENEKKKEERYYDIKEAPKFIDLDSTSN